MFESNSVSNSLNNSNGNKTYSFISKYLMTSEEINRLHYKTIIFPTIGYPVIRNTYIQNLNVIKKDILKEKYILY